MTDARVRGVPGRGRGIALLIFHAIRRRLGRVPEPVRITARRTPLLWGYANMEAGQEAAAEVPAAIKRLAQLRVSTRVGCPF